MEGALVVCGVEHEIGHDVVKRGAGRAPTRAAAEVRVDLDLARRQYGHRDLGEPSPSDLRRSQARERRSFGPVQPDRRDERVGLFRDHRRAVIDFHQRTRDRDPPLREDDEPAALTDLMDQRSRRQRLARIERARIGEFQERLHPPAIGDAVIDRENRRRVEQREDDRRVEEGDMV